MKRLDKEATILGTGIADLSATLIKRTKNVCMYERWDSIWEVFRPTIFGKGKKIFDRTYDEDTEMYPNNEAFGTTAFCFASKELAERRYNNMVSKFG